jgi:hypothetical protein
MYKLKEKEFYKKTYNVKLCRGQLFKANNELKQLKERYNAYEIMDEEGIEKDEECLEKENRLINRLELKRREINTLTCDLKTYTIEMEKHNSGELDDEYSERYEKKEEEKELRKEKRVEKKTKTNTENKKISKQYYNNSRQASSKDRYNRKQYDYHYRYFVRQNSKIPPYILTNLDRMPNNKGYIWRSIWYFGRRKIPQVKDENGKYVDDMTLKMHEIVGKDTFIRCRDQSGQWTITKKEKVHYNNNNNNYKNKNKNSYKNKHKNKR